MMKRLFCLLSLLLLPSPLLAQSWALPGWQYRIAVTVPGATQANHMVRVDVDFSSQLAALAATGSFDGLSPRVVRADGVIVPVQEFSDRIYANATDAAANGRGEIRFLATAAAPQSYYIYFDTIQNGPKPANPQLPINGNFEAGSSGQASPAGWAAPVKSNTAFDAQVRPSETVPITASPAAVDGVQTRNTDGTPSTGAFSYLIGNRSTTGGGIAGNLAVLFTRDIAVPAANPGNLQFRYRPEGWDTTGFDAIRIDLLDASGAVLTELVGPTAGNYAQRPWARTPAMPSPPRHPPDIGSITDLIAHCLAPIRWR